MSLSAFKKGRQCRSMSDGSKIVSLNERRPSARIGSCLRLFQRPFPLCRRDILPRELHEDAACDLELAMARAVESGCVSGFIEGGSFRAADGASRHHAL